jgi:hypothetical protein
VPYGGVGCSRLNRLRTLLQRLGMNASPLVWRDPDGIGRRRASWPLEAIRSLARFLLSDSRRGRTACCTLM